MEYITLMGAEAVQSAGRQMQGAADDMRRAASGIDSALDRHVERLIDALSAHARAMDDFLDGFKGALERIKPPELLAAIEPAPERPPAAPGMERCTLCGEDVPEGTMKDHDQICDGIPF